MAFLKLIAQILAGSAATVAALASILLFIRLQWPSPALWFIKLFTSALSPFFFCAGLFCLIVGITSRAMFLSVIGIYVVLVFLIHLFLTTRPPENESGFESAFGTNWKENIVSKEKEYLLTGRSVLRVPKVPHAQFDQNIPYASIPGTEQKLLCDLWQPPPGVARSGLAFIYLPGTAWYVLDKDLGTRPFFNLLAAQGHVIMNIAYRLAPETDMMGMIHDTKRAINWMKENAIHYGVDPDMIVIGGGSAGAHLSLLAAYTPYNVVFTPADLTGKDLSVHAVISMYGPSDLEAMYYHTNQDITTRNVSVPSGVEKQFQMPAWLIKKMGKEYYRLHFDKDIANAGTFAPLLGGHPDERPDMYALYSPITYVHSDCPATLLIHGAHDVMAPVASTRELYARLVENKVKTVMHILPQTDHAFDLILPNISLSAHNAIYDVQNFLELMADELNDQHLIQQTNNPQWKLAHKLKSVSHSGSD